MNRTPSLLLVIGTLAGAIVPLSRAHADDKADKVVAHVKAAQEASAKGDHAKAISEYEAGFKVVANPNLLIAIALEHREAGSVDKARTHLQRFLKEAPADHKRRTEVEELIAKLNAPAASPEAEFTPEVISLQLDDVEKPKAERERRARAAAQGAPYASVGLPTREPGREGPAGDAVEPPFYKTWWFWTLAGVIVGGTVAVGVAVSQPSANPPRACARQFVGCFGEGR